MALLNSSVSVGVASTTVLDVTPAPTLIVLSNSSDTDIFVSLGEAAVLNKGILLKANGGTLTLDSAMVVNKIYAISAGADKNLCITTV